MAHLCQYGYCVDLLGLVTYWSLVASAILSGALIAFILGD